ncbi:MAG: DUF5372 family protein [Planctomycetota bacterium]|nr:DUF5372 family protein [Planctomycetota bacterium]
MSSAPNADVESRRFRVTHPFHPLFGREFELVHYRHCWGEERVFYAEAGAEVQSIPACWTSAVTDDAVVVISAGRSLYRAADLVELSRLVRGTGR